MDVYLITALSLGFFGSFHCVGMCGPIALSLPSTSEKMLPLLLGRLLYNGGRTLTYSILGAGAGLVESSFSMNGLQSYISIISGILILIGVIIGYGPVSSGITSRLLTVNFFLKKTLRSLLKKHGLVSLFGVGLLNGILPCGFVYIALAGAAAAGTIGDSIIYMALFGLGTVPMMLGLSLSGTLMQVKIRSYINKATPVIAIALALFLIHRGIMMKEEPRSCCTPHTASSLK